MSTQTQKPEYNETNILDVLLILFRNKWFLIKLVGSVTILSLIISLVWPQKFKSSATFLPPQEQQLGGMAGGLLSNIMQTSMSNSKLDAESILTILRSRSLHVEVINNTGLREEYNSNIMEELLMKFNNNLSIVDVREGGFGFNPVIAVEVSFVDKSPERARDVVDYLLTAADSIASAINYKNNKERYDIIAKRFNRNVEEMAEAEEAFKAFQQKYGIFEIEEQSLLMVQQLGELRAAIIEAEMKIGILETTVDSNNRELQNQRRALRQLQNTYQRELVGADLEARGFDVFHPMAALPEIGQQYIRLFRELEIQNTIHEFLYPQFEQASILLDDQSRNMQIVDEPHLPTYKDSPKRAFIVIGGFMASLFIGLLMVGFRHMVSEAEQHPEKSERLSALFDALKARTDY